MQYKNTPVAKICQAYV